MMIFRNNQPVTTGFFTTKNKGQVMEELDREEQKAIVKEAIREWLDEKYAEFGKWTLHGVFAAVLAVAVGYIALHGGFK